MGLLLLVLLSLFGIYTTVPSTPSADETSLSMPQDSVASDEEAMKLMREGFRLHDEGTAESLRAAVALLERAHSITLATGNKTYQGLALLRLAESAFALGDLTKALRSNRQLLQLRETTNNQYGAASTHVRIGDIYSLLGETEKALASYQRAVPLFSSEKDQRESARLLYKIGRLNAQLQDKSAAALSYKRALMVYGNLVERLTEGNEFLEVGEIHDALGDKGKALFYFRKALEIFHGLGYYRREEAATHAKIAKVLSTQGMERDAINHYREALTIQGETGDILAEADTLGTMMAFHQKGGKDDLAIWYGKQSINLYQNVRTNLLHLNIESHKSFVRNVERHYRLLADALIRKGRLPEALQVLVLFKDQSFFDTPATTRQDPVSLALTQRESGLFKQYEEQAQAVRAAGAKLALLNLRIGDGTPSIAQMEQRKSLESASHEAARSLLQLISRVEAELSANDERTKVVKLTGELSEMQLALRELKRTTSETTIALYTLITDDDYHLLLVTPDGIKLSSRRGRAQVVKRAAHQLFMLLRSPEFDPRQKAKELYAEILQPIEADLATIRPDTLLWSLDANLRYVPMAALFDGERYLVERYKHIVFTRNDHRQLTATPTSPWTHGFGMGSTREHTVEILGEEIVFPELPGVRAELNTIFGDSKLGTKGLLKGSFVLDPDFTAEALKGVAQRNFQVVHIASHFRFLSGNEEASFLLLGNGRTLSLAEMQTMPNLFAGVELLVLSACETATQSADASGREIDAFSETAQRLGARSAIATLWRVSDDYTPDLMNEFYRQLQTSGVTKAKSLQMAQLKELRRTPGTASGCAEPSNSGSSSNRRMPYPTNAPCTHPYFWAGFILTGNGR